MHLGCLDGVMWLADIPKELACVASSLKTKYLRQRHPPNMKYINLAYNWNLLYSQLLQSSCINVVHSLESTMPQTKTAAAPTPYQRQDLISILPQTSKVKTEE